ncbi:hypothetical protein LEMLEM_LOCUS16491 [Lemmus lemmus]
MKTTTQIFPNTTLGSKGRQQPRVHAIPERWSSTGVSRRLRV